MYLVRFFTARSGIAGCLLVTAMLSQPLAMAAPAAQGLRFRCSPSALADISQGMQAYLLALGIAPGLVEARRNEESLVYTLAGAADDENTLDLHARPALGIADELVSLPQADGSMRSFPTVSRKEILLALMQRGRLTEFTGAACSLEALHDHVGVRQNIVAWTEQVEWGWPDGEAAHWNTLLWKRGTPLPGVALADAVQDAFHRQADYSIGCYTAAKLIMVQGVVDYYRRVRADTARFAQIERRLLSDGEPLVNIEPGAMWEFEPGHDSLETVRPGKLLRLVTGVAPKNHIPGDWTYLLNTDAATYGKTGYEGSNAIYLGRNRFDDFYNDNNRYFTWEQKLDEVWQWRNGVFSRLRDHHLIEFLTAAQLAQLARAPAQGGLQIALRATPYFFGAEELPQWPGWQPAAR